MKKASRKIVASPLSDEDVERLVGELAELDLAIGKSDTYLQTHQNALEAELDKIRASWQKDIDEECTAREAMLKTRNEKIALLQTWAEAHKDERFNVRRSITFLRGTLGFRQTNPALATRNKKTTWKAVVARIMRRLPAMRRYLKITYKVDKEAILRDRDKLSAKGLLEQSLLRIEQRDEFYFESKVETSDRITA